MLYPTWFFEVLCEWKGDPLVLAPFQVEYLLDTNRFKIVNKTRQAGGSFQLAMMQFFRAFTNERYKCDIVSTNLAEAADKITYIKNLHETLPKRWQLPLTRSNTLSVGFHNGSKQSVIRSVAATGTSVRGGSKNLCFDEFGHVKGAEELFFSALPAIVRNAAYGVDIVSTPRGDLNLFAKIWKNDTNYLTGKKEWNMFNGSRHAFIWVDVPQFCNDYELAQKRWRIDYKENMDYMPQLVDEFAVEIIQTMRANNPWEWFEQEFCGVFLTELDAYFSLELISSCLKGSLGEADDQKEDAVIPWTVEQGRTPDAESNEVFMGVDFGESSETTDKTSIQVLERLPSGRFLHRYSKVLSKRQYPSFPAQAAFIVEVAQAFRITKVYCDETGLGRGLVPMIRELDARIPLEGINFNLESKEMMVTNVKKLMETDKLWLQAKATDLHAQIRGIRREISPISNQYRYSGKPFDDMFWALALAARAGAYKKFAMWTLGGDNLW